jgi:hypothetical protein
MSKLFNNIIDTCVEKIKNDDNIKNKLENELFNPAFLKAYIRLKPYILYILYMYGVIVLLLIIIILLLIFKKK